MPPMASINDTSQSVMEPIRPPPEVVQTGTDEDKANMCIVSLSQRLKKIDRMNTQTLQGLDDFDGTNTTFIRQSVSSPDLSRPGLLVMDVDSTLIDEEVIDQLGEAAGAGERIADITARTMAGELDFCDALRARVALLKGLPVSVFDEVTRSVHFTNGALELIEALHAHGWKVGAVSGGFHEIVDHLAAQSHVDYWLANRLEVRNATLSGQIVGEIVCRSTKLRALRQWAEETGVDMSQTVAVGDGANDIPMIETAGLGIAFCAKPAVQQAASVAINTRDLMKVLELLR
jgi:phosphoserine phosphatase